MLGVRRTLPQSINFCAIWFSLWSNSSGTRWSTFTVHRCFTTWRMCYGNVYTLWVSIEFHSLFFYEFELGSSIVSSWCFQGNHKFRSPRSRSWNSTWLDWAWQIFMFDFDYSCFNDLRRFQTGESESEIMENIGMGSRFPQIIKLLYYITKLGCKQLMWNLELQYSSQFKIQNDVVRNGYQKVYLAFRVRWLSHPRWYWSKFEP